MISFCVWGYSILSVYLRCAFRGSWNQIGGSRLLHKWLHWMIFWIELYSHCGYGHGQLTVHSHSAQSKLTVNSHSAQGKLTVHSHTAQSKLTVHSHSAQSKLTVHSRSPQGKLTVHSHSAQSKLTVHSHSAQGKLTVHSHSALGELTVHSHYAQSKLTVHSHSAHGTPICTICAPHFSFIFPTSHPASFKIRELDYRPIHTIRHVSVPSRNVTVQ